MRLERLGHWARGFFLGAVLLFAAPAAAETITLTGHGRVFDGAALSPPGPWSLTVREGRIGQWKPEGDKAAPDGSTTLDLGGLTLLPGLIEGHSHLLLHPYDEADWNDQVLKEPRALRVARAVVHAKRTLLAGFTTIRDLGSEGAGYADVGLRQAIAENIVPGPRMFVAGPAIVATGSYGPKGFHSGVKVPLGAQTADGHDDLIRVTREQIGGGVDWIKVYADYRWGPKGEARPTFSLAELKLIV